MQQNLVEKLRDIHEPAAPTGDSLLLIALLVVLIFATLSLARSLWRLYRPAMPAWQRRALDDLDRARHLTDGDSLATAAIVLRRAVAQMDATADMSNASGNHYLQQLDALFDCDFFSNGSGAVFGDRLYRRQVPASDVSDAIDGVSKLLRQNRS